MILTIISGVGVVLCGSVFFVRKLRHKKTSKNSWLSVISEFFSSLP